MATPLKRAKEVFDRALEIESDDERASFLNEELAGHPEIRRNVEDLLESLGRAGSFLESPPSGIGATKTLSPEISASKSIGPYKLLQKIGEGGMGVVYMAEQQRPVKRRVALKLIRAGGDSRPVVARFEAERQALALMDHPNIAKVFDGGTTEDGRPYFVMELVNGIAITQYCDENQLSVEERLRLFGSVCRAVEHAHQKGIIHRDLKPSNVLVAEYDHDPVPKVIDFGVAKATVHSLTDKTLATSFGQVIGTLEYMSPEQSKRNQLDVDTRTDVYSLGVLLYEMLTGDTPIAHETMRAAAIDEILRLIREQEPPRPSQRLSTCSSLPSVAASRNVEPSRLGKILRGELDWIVMKSLEKDRKRRYETVSQLADDVSNHLNNEPVSACPPSLSYRCSKFIRRNRLFAYSVASVAIVMFVGLIGLLSAAAILSNQKAALISQLYATKINLGFEFRNDGNFRHLQNTVADLTSLADRADSGIEFDLLRSQLRQMQPARTINVNGIIEPGAIAYDPMGTYLAIAKDGLFIYDINSGRLSKRSTEVEQCSISADGGVVVCSNPKLIRDEERPAAVFYPDAKGELTDSDWPLPEKLFRAVISPDGELIVGVAADQMLTAYQLSSGTKKWSERIDDHTYVQLAFSHDGSLLASGGRDETLHLRSADTGKSIDSYTTEGWVEDIAFSPDDATIAAATDEGSMSWDLSNRELSKPHPVKIGRSTCVAFSADNRLVAFGCDDRTVRLLDRETFSVQCVLPQPSYVHDLAFHPNSRKLAVATFEDGIQIWNNDAWTEADTYESDPTFFPALAVSSGGIIAWASRTDSGRAVEVLYPDAESPKLLPERLPAGTRAMSFSSDETMLAIGCDDGTVMLWNLDSRQTQSFDFHEGTVYSVCISPDGRYLASGGKGPAVHVFDLELSRPVTIDHQIEGGKWGLSIRFSQSGLLVAGGGAWQKSGNTKAWRLEAGEFREKRSWKHPNLVRCLDVAPGGDRAVLIDSWSASNFQIVRLDQPDSVIEFGGHTSHAAACIFSSDGRRIITGGDDGSICFWDASNGAPLGNLMVGNRAKRHGLCDSHISKATQRRRICFSKSGRSDQSMENQAATRTRCSRSSSVT